MCTLPCFFVTITCPSITIALQLDVRNRNNNSEALAAVCMRRGVDLSNVNVYLDSSKTPLSLITTETFWLGGKHLRIKGI